MESQLPRTHGHHYEPTDLSTNPPALQSGVEGHSEAHHEKPSVLKKVKAKAKKIKNTLTKHGHEHEHDHDHDHDEYEEDEDDEMVKDPEIHGAPIYESAAVRSATLSSGQPAAGPAGGTNLDRPSMVGPRYDSPFVDPETRPFVQWQADEEHGKHLLEEHKHAPLPCKLVDTRTGEDVYHELPHKGINTRTGRDVREERENPDQVGGRNVMEGIRGGIGSTCFDVDPQGPDIRTHPSNVQVKTIDPAGRGSEEAEGITPVIQSFNEMGISEEKPERERGEGGRLYTGSHNQFAPEPLPSQSSSYVPKSGNAANPQDMPGDIYDPASKSSSYSGKFISDSVPKSYDAANPQDLPEDTYEPSNKGSTYTEKITSASAAAASAIADTAQSAKNVISSKIGQMRQPGEGNKSGSVTGEGKSGSVTGEGNKSGSVTETASDYAHKIAATVTDTLAPVYGKVVGVGSAATSKLSGLGAETTQESGGNATSKVSGLGAETTQESGGNAGQDKGVSVKEYWVEKLKPGEEDKVLSTMITESFSKPKGEKTEEVPSGGGGRSISQIVSDAVHKREPEESEQHKPMGKVTESEEVAKRLGTGEEGSGLENIGTGAGVVNKLTGAIGSWFGGQGGRAQSTPGTTLADDNEGAMGKNAEGVAGERRLQESSN
ncbi:low-temperature-induced 65 kDa protein [Daucus carota subsp. sativus]|uniref:low-temperature-induced 65 kDa protein n=1 Tax=Daucus carota subsp. sativus TaxID=79200 RepID=UPI0007B19675|nr:PREDICTED: low-temperature-induced 65 kDa protein-like [Daucus carota subsp. sativus]